MVERVSRNENCSLTPVSSQKCSGSKYFMQEFCCGRLLLDGVLWGFTLAWPPDFEAFEESSVVAVGFCCDDVGV